MPVISIEASAMNKDQKEALIQSFTKTASEILNLPEQAFVVLINEYNRDNIGTGGKMLSKVLAENNKK